MSESKHTPGPWRISAGIFWADHGPGDSAPRPPATIHAGPAKIESGRAHILADAALIAAAPDMYEALVDGVRGVIPTLRTALEQGTLTLQSSDWREFVAKAEAALAKAEGR